MEEDREIPQLPKELVSESAGHPGIGRDGIFCSERFVFWEDEEQV